jgi:transaldolase/glucose-6-phosphate isomerase
MATSDLTWALPSELETKVRARMAQMREQDVVRRIWAADPSVWTGTDEDRWLGWLQLPVDERPALDRAVRLGSELKREQVSDVVLLGMGGSSLTPEVIQSIIGPHDGYPILHVLDSTDPAQILAVERRIDFSRALFLVASKSGSTLEVNILKQYFFSRAVEKFGDRAAGRHFVLTTDPGSKLQHVAEEEHFREIFPGVPSVGGRYSALSNFGIVPAAAIGADVALLLERAEAMARRSAADDGENSALQLGVILGVLAQEGRDKPTLISPPALAGFGAWMEQLIAESLGKHGKGIIPINGETPGPPEVYGSDRVFIHLRLAGVPDTSPYISIDAQANRLERAGQPVVRIEWADRYALGAEFYRWEFATAVMGAVLGVNPFDQPDVEESKIVTRRLAAEFEKTGKLPEDVPLLQQQGLALFTGSKLRQALGDQTSVASCLKAFLGQLHAGDYFALLAFIEMNEEHERALEAIRGLVRDRVSVATTVGFGPRFLHSTGQAHKGGPNSGVFLQITADTAQDLPVPGQRYSFGTIELAQARGDFEVLAARGRRLLRVHLKDPTRGLQTLHAALLDALG